MQATVLHTPEAKFEAVSILHRMTNSGYDEETDRFRAADVSSKMYAEMFLLTEQERQTVFAPVIELYQYVKNHMEISSEDMQYYFSLLPACQKSVAEIIIFIDLIAKNAGVAISKEQKKYLLAELIVSTLSNPDAWSNLVVPKDEAELLRFLENTPCENEEAYKLLDMYVRFSEHWEKAFAYAAQATALYLKKAYVAIPQVEDCCSRLEEGIAAGTHPILQHEMVHGKIESCMIFPSIMGYSFVRVIKNEGYYKQKYSLGGQDYIRYGILVDTLEVYKQAKLDEQKQLIQSIKVLGDKNRLLIITALNNRPMRGHELATLTGLTPATVSHHIKALVGNGFVDVEKQGTSFLYKMNTGNLSNMISQLEAQLQTNLIP